MRRVVVACSIVGLGVLGAAPAVGAAGYPPGSSTSVPGTTTTVGGSQSAGSFHVGSSFTTELCGFTANSTVALSVDGNSAGSKAVAGNTCAAVTIKIDSTTQGEVDDPVLVALSCGQNNVSATGTSSSGGSMTQTTTFTVLCTSAGGPAFTGANVVRWTSAGLALIAMGVLLVLAARRRVNLSA